MKCFNHLQLDAVGICKNCHKGLCKECAIDVGNGIACKDNCEIEVKAINEVINRNKTVYQKTSRAYVKTAIFDFLFGIVFLIFGLIVINDLGPLGYLCIAMGSLLCIYGIFTYLMAKKFVRQ